jgi:hypothetical protein
MVKSTDPLQSLLDDQVPKKTKKGILDYALLKKKRKAPAADIPKEDVKEEEKEKVGEGEVDSPELEKGEIAIVPESKGEAEAATADFAQPEEAQSSKDLEPESEPVKEVEEVKEAEKTKDAGPSIAENPEFETKYVSPFRSYNPSSTPKKSSRFAELTSHKSLNIPRIFSKLDSKH